MSPSASGHSFDDAIAAALDSLDDLLAISIVTFDRPGAPDRLGQRWLGDDRTRPDSVEQVVLVHEPLTVFDQVKQQAEDFWLNVGRAAVDPDLPEPGVDLAIYEAIRWCCARVAIIARSA